MLSVITVHKDDLAGLRRSLASLESQNEVDAEIQHIIVDGSAQKLQTDVLAVAQNLQSRVVFSPPEGIYPAMNLGLREATGKYLLFLNAGDELASADVLRNVLTHLLTNNPSWVYGRLVYVQRDGRQRIAPDFDYETEKAHLFRRGRFPQQPSCVYQRAVVQALGGFDTRYLIAADYHLMLRLSKRINPDKLEIPISRFHANGTSSIFWRQSLIESRRARLSVFSTGHISAVREYVLSLPTALKAIFARLSGRV